MGDQVVNVNTWGSKPLLHMFSGCFHFANLSPLCSSGPTTSCPIPTSFWPFSTVETFPFWPKTVCAHAKKNSQGVFNRRAGQKKETALEFSLQVLSLKTCKNVSSFVCTWPRLDAVNMLIE